MQCELISIGDELLIGQVVNTNAAWLGRELTGLGFNIRQVTTIPDDKDIIVEMLRKSMARAQWVFVTGGLGPTKDDITKEALVSVFGGKMVFHEDTWQQLGKIYARFGRTLSDAHKEQCYLPTSARILPNAMGTAPGLLFEQSHCKVCVMPGVPFEMEHIMLKQVVPLIHASAVNGTIIYKTVATVGEAESVLASSISDIEEQLPEGIRIAYLPSPGRVRIRVTGSGIDTAKVSRRVDEITSRIVARVGEYVYATEDIDLADAVGRKLRTMGSTVSVAESCTGGYLGHLITAIPNSSDYFPGGAITYSNALKHKVLGVQSETIDTFGAVSEETVREMAEGARRAFRSDYAIAISGIAGPSGGTPDKPVGTVWLAVACDRETVARKYVFGKDRLRNIEFSATYALDMLRRMLDGIGTAQ